ncbi:hypothetical protein ZIOFF_025350 [Zingiber officinale]|uniref:Uncharacterized protein n=1 Tax=Zingiber officinale TaxID=94328 RepID=A0A8J5HAS7_ZINOF|nr:hypothetical protein ZIOFF_025350 [Zingiber officinale]
MVSTLSRCGSPHKIDTLVANLMEEGWLSAEAAKGVPQLVRALMADQWFDAVIHFTRLKVVVRVFTSIQENAPVSVIMGSVIGIVMNGTILSLFCKLSLQIFCKLSFEETLHFCNNSAFCKKAFAEKKAFHFCKLSFCSLKKRCISASFLSFFLQAFHF